MALFRAAQPRYIGAMKQLSSMPVSTAAKIALGVAVLAAATGLAFASWIDKGAGIFMAMVESRPLLVFLTSAIPPLRK